MKKILLIISFAVCQTTSGQQIDQSNNRYRSYDVLEKKQVTIKGFDLNSKNGVWSLEDAELSEDTYNAVLTSGRFFRYNRRTVPMLYRKNLFNGYTKLSKILKRR